MMLSSELDIVHQGVLRAAPLLWRNDGGELQLTLAVCGTFELHHGGVATLAETQTGPGLVAPDKPLVDILVLADAHAPTAAPVTQLEVAIAIAGVNKSLTVTGDRSWIASGRGMVMGQPAPFRQLPLSYERAVAGAFNPSGIGFEARAGAPLPNIAAIGPGAAAIAPGFAPLDNALRARHAGLSAAHRHWLELGLARYEPMPAGFDRAYFQLAPMEQRVARFAGTQSIRLTHLVANVPRFEGSIAVPEPAAVVLERPGHREIALRCDTVVIDASRGIATLTWRGTLPVPDLAALRRAAILVSQSRQPHSDVAPMVAARSPRLRSHTLVEDFGVSPRDQPLPFVTGFSEDDDGPPTIRPTPPEAYRDGATPFRASRRVRADTAMLDDDLMMRAVSPFAPAAADPLAHDAALPNKDDPDLALRTSRLRDTAEIPATNDDGALPFARVQPRPAASALLASPGALSATALGLQTIRLGYVGVPAPTPAADPVPPAVPAARDAEPPPRVASPAALPQRVPPPSEPPQRFTSPSEPPGRVPSPAPLAFAVSDGPSRVRPPDPLAASAAGPEPARLSPPTAAAAAPSEELRPIDPVAPARIGPLAGSLRDPASDVAAAEPAANDQPAVAPPNEADAAEAPASSEASLIPLERLAAIEACLQLYDDDEHAAVLERFEVTQQQLEAARSHHHEQQAQQLHRGQRALLDQYDSAYLDQLEKERGPITVEDYAALEVALERDALADVLPSINLPRPSVLPIKRHWMRKLMTDPALSKSARQAIARAREA